MNRFSRMPFFVQLMLVSGGAMLVPAFYALILREWDDARAFLYPSVLVCSLAGFIAIALFRPEATEARDGRRDRDREGRNQLLTLLGTYTALPLVLAVPFVEATQDTTFLNGYFEMVSALTTTGATLFDDPARLSRPEHLWTALVAWLGGLFAWVTAVAVLAPLNLGGFEVISSRQPGQSDARASQITRIAAAPERMARFTTKLFPIYIGLTLALWFALAMVGSPAFVALIHAMSVMSTSGISPVGGLTNTRTGFVGELLIFAFLFLALSRKTFTADNPRPDAPPLWRDPEMKIGLALMVAVPLLLFLRHWVAVLEVSGDWTFGRALSSLWGSMFMVLSFLSTAGFESMGWEEARLWSGLQAPGVLLMGLAIFGGGVATTAGGVKLLRLYALVRHGEREIEKLVSPHSVGGAGANARRIRREGAYVAWVYFMVFAFTIAGVMMLLALLGLDFERAAIFTISALTTTGPLVRVAGTDPMSYAALTDPMKLVLAGTMVLGRLEMLAIIALLNPEFWRR
ncbi:TrkH family potassium uptake protein [Celeribacter indicus]|uniref:Trk system potassium uptake protein TrkH n=1 Tax=Celeribacter indicus TaxID=1208324 RepID=A0A0B5DVB7_9RHOB|nr:potassium transporter TrkG [Celeribacter indicus]AJE46964.1 trk system potassium uptake protein TrkH [Celeribacter indicus]SDW77468.1 trk system potassium uptake protein TrkH [Celeribacter indicus]